MSGEDGVRSSLIGVLAESWWLRKHSELTMTLSLSHLLSGPECAERFARLVSKRVGATMPVLTAWVTEQVQPDRARPDVEAFLEGGGAVSLVKVEAKLGATMSAAQLHSFAKDQLKPLMGGRPGHPDDRPRFVVLLVPETRWPEACTLLGSMEASEERPGAFRLTAAGAHPAQFVAVVTWEELSRAFQGLSEFEAGDVKAFDDLYNGLHAVAIPPFTVEDLTFGWQGARSDIAVVLQTATQRMFEGRVNPWEPEAPDFLERRYVSRIPGTGDRIHFAVGIREPRAEAPTPAWLRYHPRTPGFTEVARNLTSGPYSGMLTRDDKGSVWLPLYLPEAVPFEAAVLAVMDQIERIDDAARQVVRPATLEPRPIGKDEISERFRRRRVVFGVAGGTVCFAEAGADYAVIIDETSLLGFIDDSDGELAELVGPHGLAFTTQAARWGYVAAGGWIGHARQQHRSTGEQRRRSTHVSRTSQRQETP